MLNAKKRKTRKVSKGDVLLSSGDIAIYGYQVLSGCLRSYVIDRNGKEHILQFAPEDWLITDLDSAMNKKPSAIFIDAIEDSEVISVRVAEFMNFHSLDKNTLVEMNLKFRNSIIASNKRVINMLCATAEDRYLEFLETYPDLAQRIPQKLIASYIGITPEYLSDLRRKLANK
ncbi:Crp/Fnr family transcriptional regulator [Neolewinella agarilytica]|uniref:cAMP-binding domain of CRP or a regulatory subunit of cAMP-dependent protein kinases n=1 Tax=Neolewinella agarilytica TaxID=478744 RepID=A0A1H9K3I3_9BACT|nr:Crp/Fnr family transcriptional regulator [Neolewinella agarilytica]SEQ93761.1 cAMP-binding domain of CRP or a regulatory subunit of cAMP-dependent protein kinases [Neolewinella agarilytica]